MIKKYGQVVITEDSVEVTGFHFDGSDGKNPGIEVLEWAKQRLSAQQYMHLTGLSAAQKEEVRQMIQSALDTGSA